MTDQPSTFVLNKYFLKYSNLETICRNTYEKYKDEVMTHQTKKEKSRLIRLHFKSKRYAAAVMTMMAYFILMTQHRCSNTQQKVFDIFCLTSYEGGAETTSTSSPCIRCRSPRKGIFSKNSKTANGQNSSISKKNFFLLIFTIYDICE